MQEVKTPTLDVVQMKQKREQLTMAVGQRAFNQEVLKAENIRDTQEILNLCNQINTAEAQFKTKLTEVPPVETVEVVNTAPNVETPQVV